MAGDSPFLTRFFDVILKGCIPVVLEWELFQQSQFGGRGVGEKKLSWHIPDRVRICLPTEVFKPKHYSVSNIVETYPFIDSLSTYNNTNDPKSYEWSIDYRSFVVVAKGRVGADEEYQSDMRPIFEAMKSALRVRESAVSNKVAQWIGKFSMGMGNKLTQLSDFIDGRDAYPIRFWNNLIQNDLCKRQAFLYSTADSLTDSSKIEELIQARKSRGIQVLDLNFQDSEHVQHWRQYPKEYEDMLDEILRRC